MSKRVSIREQCRGVDTAPAYAFISSDESKLSTHANETVANNNNVISPPAPLGLDQATIYRIYDIVNKMCQSNQAITEIAFEAALTEIRSETLPQTLQDHLTKQLTDFTTATDDRIRNWHALGLFSYLQGIIDCMDALLSPTTAG